MSATAGGEPWPEEPTVKVRDRRAAHGKKVHPSRWGLRCCGAARPQLTLGTFWELVPTRAFGTGSVATWNIELVAARPATGSVGLAAGSEWGNSPGIAKGSEYLQLLGRRSTCKCCVLKAANLCWMD